MAEQSLRFTLDFLAKTAGLKNANELLDVLSDELDGSVDAGKRFAQTMRTVADRVESDLEQTAAVARQLADALGTEMSAAIGQSRLENYAAQMRAAGLSTDDVTANVEELADSIRRLEGAKPSIDSTADGMQRVAKETDKTGSVMANFAGNAVQELPLVGNAFGPLNTAIGQFAEYATEGDISLGKFVRGFAGVAAAAGVMALIAARINEARQAQEELKQRTDEVVSALESQISKAYDLANATDAVTSASDGLAAGQSALNAALLQSGESGEKLREAFGAIGLSVDDAAAQIGAMSEDSQTAMRDLAKATGLSDELAAQFASTIVDMDADFRIYATDLEQATENTDWFNEASGDAAELQEDLANELVAAGRAAGMTDGEIAALGVSLQTIRDESQKIDLDEITKQFLNNSYASNEAARSLIDLAEANLGVSRSDDALAVYDEFNRLLGESSMATRDAVLGTNELGDAYDKIKTGQEQFIRRMERQRDVLLEAEEAQRDYTSAVLDASTGLLDTLDAEDRFTQAVADAATAVDDATTPVDEYAAAQRDAERAALDVAQSYVDMGRDLAAAAGKTLTAQEENQLLIDALRGVADTLAPGNPLRRRLDDYIYNLDKGVPDEVNTEVTARYNMELGKLGYADVNNTGGIGSRFGTAFGNFNLVVNVTNPVMSGEQIAAELAAYLRRSGATFKLFGG
jgi:hypothetical protein